MAQLMPLPLTVSCFSKMQIGFTFLVLAHSGNPTQRAVKLRACVLALEMASRGNQLCASCIGALSFPIQMQPEVYSNPVGERFR